MLYVTKNEMYLNFILKVDKINSTEYKNYLDNKYNEYINKKIENEKKINKYDYYIKLYKKVERVLNNALKWREDPLRDTTKDNNNLLAIEKLTQTLVNFKQIYEQSLLNIEICNKNIDLINNKLKMSSQQKITYINREIKEIINKTKLNCINFLSIDGKQKIIKTNPSEDIENVIKILLNINNIKGYILTPENKQKINEIDTAYINQIIYNGDNEIYNIIYKYSVL
jgi:hypothetical protein